MAMRDLAPLLGDRFGPVTLLSEDGKSQTFRGAGADGPVAVKVFRWPLEGPEQSARFAAEVRRVTALAQDGLLVPVLGAGLLPQDHPYVVTRLCAGGSIDRWMPLPAAVACEVVETIGRAVAAIHDAGVVHGQIRPSKILVGRDGSPQLGLFGVSAMTEPPPHVVIDGAFSLAYFAPEPLYGLRVERAADVFGLGAVLYALLTGRPPGFPPDHVPHVMRQLDLLRLPAPEDPAVPPGLLSVIRKAMRPDPDERYRDVDELLAEIARLRTFG